MPANLSERITTVNDLTPKSNNLKYVHLAWLPMVWAIQYACVIPCLWMTYLTVDAMRVATKLGIAGIVLMCIPIIGWIMLGIMAGNAMSGRNKHKHTYPTSPWFKGVLA